MKKRRILYTVLAAMVLGTGLTGCSSTAQPIAIDEKVDTCADCNMAVKNNQFAVQLIQDNGKALKFDDLGCLFNWEHKHSEAGVKEQFVRDYDSQEWINIEDATYVFDKDIVTPMAYNVISFKSSSSAEEFLKKQGHGELLTYQQLLDHTFEQNKEMMKKLKEMHKGNMGGHGATEGNGMSGGHGGTDANGMSGSDMKSGM